MTSDRLENLQFQQDVELQFLRDTMSMLLDYQCSITEEDFTRVRNLIVEIRGYRKAIADEIERLNA